MFKWLLGLLVFFLFVDHIWVHFGSPMVERIRHEYREDFEKVGSMEKTDVQLKQSYRESLLDQVWEKIKSLRSNDQGQQGGS